MSDSTTDLALWRRRFETTLAEEYGWLTLAGLFWFDQGTATLGTADDNDFVLDPDPLLPARVGTLEFNQGRLSFTPAPGVPVTLDGQDLTGPTRLNFEDEPNPSVVSVGALRLYPIHRGPRFGLRARNPLTVYRRTFAGLNWLPENPALRIVAEFHRWPEPRPLAVVNVLGDAEPTVSQGEIRFTLGGQGFAFLAEPGRDGGFFVNFKDGSTGKTTYPGGRFLYTPAPVGDTVVLDFNQAHSPPCSRTPYAVCPRPPQPNFVPFPLEAGEVYPHVTQEFRP
jgi:uncharacterized protein (DUF1684 family)